MTEHLHRKASDNTLTVPEAVELVRLRYRQPALSGFITSRDVRRAARVLADHVHDCHVCQSEEASP